MHDAEPGGTSQLRSRSQSRPPRVSAAHSGTRSQDAAAALQQGGGYRFGEALASGLACVRTGWRVIACARAKVMAPTLACVCMCRAQAQARQLCGRMGAGSPRAGPAACLRARHILRMPACARTHCRRAEPVRPRRADAFSSLGVAGQTGGASACWQQLLKRKYAPHQWQRVCRWSRAAAARRSTSSRSPGSPARARRRRRARTRRSG